MWSAASNIAAAVSSGLLTPFSERLRRYERAHQDDMDGHVVGATIRSAQIALAVFQLSSVVPTPFVIPMWVASFLAMPLVSLNFRFEGLDLTNPLLMRIADLTEKVSPIVVLAAKITSIFVTTTLASIYSPVVAGVVAAGLTFTHFIVPYIR